MLLFFMLIVLICFNSVFIKIINSLIIFGFLFFILICPICSNPSFIKIGNSLITFEDICTAYSSVWKQLAQSKPPSFTEKEVKLFTSPHLAQQSIIGANPPRLNNFNSYINIGTINSDSLLIHSKVEFNCLYI